MADQQHGSVDLVDVARDVLRVVGQTPERVPRRQHRHVVSLEESSMTGAQYDASANPPCTRTTVGVFLDSLMSVFLSGGVG